MVCAVNKIDSNVVGTAFAEEECLKELPVSPVWYGVEANSFADFGGEFTSTARSPIDPSRQNKKGSIVDLSATGGFNSDFTPSNLTRLLQGFFFADARELPSTAPLNGTQLAITSVSNAGGTYGAASGLGVFANETGMSYIVLASGFNEASNNGIKTVSAASATSVTVTESLVDETPPAGAKLEVVGWQFDAGEVEISVSGNIPSLVASTADFTTLAGALGGAWLFIGGDTPASNAFANNQGYARIKSVSATEIVFDDTTFSGTAETAVGKTIQVFAPVVIRNEPLRALINRRSYNIERSLGDSPAGNPQAEYLVGAVPNEFVLNIPNSEKLTCDLSFVACDYTTRSGEAGDEVKSGTRVSAPGEDAFNSSNNISRIKFYPVDAATSNPSALFGYVMEGSLTIANNVSPNKAVGVLGAFDVTAGNFDLSGSLTAYLTSTEIVTAIRANEDLAFNVIGAADNKGWVFDVPLMGTGAAKVNVEKDAPITIPVTPNGAENSLGYTALYAQFNYLPDAAIPE